MEAYSMYFSIVVIFLFKSGLNTCFLTFLKNILSYMRLYYGPAGPLTGQDEATLGIIKQILTYT